MALVSWPDARGLSSRYSHSEGACYAEVRKWSFEKRQTQVFIEAMHLIVRDGMPPGLVHGVLLGLEEYRNGCSNDMPGVAR